MLRRTGSRSPSKARPLAHEQSLRERRTEDLHSPHALGSPRGKRNRILQSAFGASELFRVDSEDGAVVARLAVGGAEVWVADESPENKNFNPESLGGGTVRMVM